MRVDKKGSHRGAYEKNRKKILKTQDTCAICGKPVDKKLKPPHPLSPAIDHIIPIAKGGHPSDIQNLQLTHMTCNRAKSDKLFNIDKVVAQGEGTIGNRNLPWSIDWSKYKR